MRQPFRTPEPDLYHFERLAWGQGCAQIAGVDEVGRGPLAGPVVAAAVVLPPDGVPTGVTDSKSLTPRQRRHLAAALRCLPGLRLGLGVVSVAEIDRLNILRATHAAMRAALLNLDPLPDLALVDGLPVPGLPVASRAIVRGDALSISVAAASILAKVYRDQIMIALDAEYPGYGLARHKGYGTREHLQALSRLGPTPAHRRSFAPVAQLLGQRPTQLEFCLDTAGSRRPEAPP